MVVALRAFGVDLQDLQEDVLSHWWDQGPGVPWVRLTWADGNASGSGWNGTSVDGVNWDRPIVVPQESYEMPILVGVGDLLAEDGVTANQGVRVFFNEETGKIDLEYLKLQLIERLTYELRYTLDFETWHDVELTPEEVVLGNGGSRVCYRDLEQLSGVSAERCFFEVLVTDLGGNLGF